MLDEILNELTESVRGHDLSDYFVELINEDKLQTPSVVPEKFDETWEAWLYRIGQWGDVTITHENPEYKTKKKLTPKQFIATATDDSLLKAMGVFDKPEKLDVNKCLIKRTYDGLDGKKYTEKFIVLVTLKPSLKKAAGL